MSNPHVFIYTLASIPFERPPLATLVHHKDLVRLPNLQASLMPGDKRNRRHRRSRTRYSRKVSNKLHRDPGRSRREIIGHLAGLKAFKECGVFGRTGSQEEFLKMPLHLQILGR
jgi:hypothetical protein